MSLFIAWGVCLCSTGGNANKMSQIFIGNGTNINVGYGDCSRPEYFVHPDNYGYPGPFGSCL